MPDNRLQRQSAEAGSAGKEVQRAPWRREVVEELVQEEQRVRLLLKSGCSADVRRALAELDDLGAMLRVHPQQFHALLAIARHGLQDGVSPETIEALKEGCWLYADGTLSRERRDLLLSSYRDTPEGPVLVNPFRLEGENDRQVVEQAAAKNLRALKDIVSGQNGDTKTR